MKNEKDKDEIIRIGDGRLDAKKEIAPKYLTYIVTDNKTTKNGCVINKSDIDAEICKRETDANEK